MYLKKRKKRFYGFLGDYSRKMGKDKPTPLEMYKLDKKRNDCFKKATGVLFVSLVHKKPYTYKKMVWIL